MMRQNESPLDFGAAAASATTTRAKKARVRYFSDHASFLSNVEMQHEATSGSQIRSIRVIGFVGA